MASQLQGFLTDELQTSHTHSGGPEDVYPQLQYGQAEPWMRRRGVQSPTKRHAMIC